MLDTAPPPAIYDEIVLPDLCILPGMAPFATGVASGGSFGDAYLVPKKTSQGANIDSAAAAASVVLAVTPSEVNGAAFIHIYMRHVSLTGGSAAIAISDATGATWTLVAQNDFTSGPGPTRQTVFFCADLGVGTVRNVTMTLPLASAAILAVGHPMDKGTVVMGSVKGTGTLGDVTLTHGDWPTSLFFGGGYNATSSGAVFNQPANPAGGTAVGSWTQIQNGWSGTSLNMVGCFQSTNRDRSDQFGSTTELSAISSAVVTPFKSGQAATFTSGIANVAGGILVGVHKGIVAKSSATKKATVLSANNYVYDSSGATTTTVTGIPLGDDSIEDRVIMICASIENMGTRAPNAAQALLAGKPISQVAYWANEVDSGSIFIGHIPKGTGTVGTLTFTWNAGPTQVAVLYSVWILQGLNFPNALQAWTASNANGSAVTTYSNDKIFIPDDTIVFRHLLQRTGAYGTATPSAPGAMVAGIFAPDVPSQGLHIGPAGTASANNLTFRSNVAFADNQDDSLTNITVTQGQAWTSSIASIHKGQAVAVS
jgi:hypothetical protein